MGVPVMAQWSTNPTRNHEVSVQTLASLSGLRIWGCYELWCSHRCGSDPVLLWLWRRLVPTAPIRPLTWESPYAVGVALKKAKRQKKKRPKHKSQKQ